MSSENSVTVDARIRYLEQLSQQLNQQIKVMKQLVTTEVSDLKGVMQQQVAEIKQIVMHQDRINQERIRRLEARVEQLSEFAMQLARCSGTTASIHAVPVEMLAAAPSGAIERSVLAPGKTSPRAASPPKRAVAQDEDDDDMEKGVAGIIQKYQDKLSSVYDHYTQSTVHVFHPAMTLSHFTRLCKDCGLCGFEQGVPVELLWMAVIRKLGRKKTRPVLSSKHHTSVMMNKYAKTPREKEANFAFERLNQIPKQWFGECLLVLAQETLGKQRTDLPEEQLLETFLVTEVFSNVDRQLELARAQPTLTAPEMMGAATLQEYKTEGVRGLIREYMARLKESFKESIRAAQSYHDEYMTLDGFVEFVRRHDLFSLIAKPDVRQIFLACSAIEASKRPDAKPDTITIPSFLLAIYHLADRIYGDALYADKYQTPEARVQKLLAKMYLLS